MRKSVFTAEYRSMLRLLKQEREARRISQEQLAKRLDATQAFVSKCERGERRLDVVELSWFCDAMGFSLQELIRKMGLDCAERD